MVRNVEDADLNPSLRVDRVHDLYASSLEKGAAAGRDVASAGHADIALNKPVLGSEDFVDKNGDGAA